MATNPMQRKARNSFLLGMLVTLIIAGAVIALLFMQLTELKKKEKKEQDSYIEVFTLNRDVKSGEEITVSDLIKVKTAKTAVPTNAIVATDLGIKNISKIDLKIGTVLSADMIYIDETQTGSDVRKQEYNTIVLPMNLNTGDYIDIRLSLPTGQDFLVVSKKIVEIPQISGIDSLNTIWLNMSEEETLAMTNAIYDSYKINGSKLYADIYVEPGIQESASPTYAVNEETINLIKSDPNILANAKKELNERYNANNSAIVQLRNNYINSAVTAAGEEAQTRVETEIQKSINNSQETRKEYLNSLADSTY